MRTSIVGKYVVATVAVLALVCMAVHPASGTSRTWTGTTSDNWWTTTNWDPSGSPADSDHLVVLSGTPTTASDVSADGGGSITFDGAATVGTFSSYLYIGDTGVGSLDILNAADLFNTGGYIGLNSSSSGEVTVNGAGSTWTNSYSLYVGYAGSGSLSLAAGAMVSCNYAYVGQAGTGSGQVTVSGAGSTVTNSGNLYLGTYGEGSMTVTAGGKVSNQSAYFGSQSTGRGQATVSGAGSTWTNSSELYAGYNGDGSLSITDGGKVSNTVGYLGYNNTGSGQVTVSGSGSTWTNSSYLFVGWEGTGSLTVDAGGQVSNTIGILGQLTGSSGDITVSGAGSTWTNSGYLSVGSYGNGSLAVTSGGTVSNTSGYVGEQSGTTGAVMVSGAGSTWTSSGGLWVGYDGGDGTLRVTDGGAVATNLNGYLGFGSTSSGEAVVSGSGSKWTCSDVLVVGHNGDGSLTITDGGKVFNTAGHLGYYSTGSGQATVSGAGSTWTCTDDLVVGREGTGTLTVADGAYVRTDGDLKVASESGSTGTVNLEGGTLSADAVAAPVGTDTFNWTGGTLKVTGTGGLSLATTGLLGTNVGLSPGKALDVTKTTTVNSGVTLNLTGGSFSTKDLTVDGTARLRSGDATIANSFSVGSSGLLEINGHDIALAASPTLSGGARLSILSGSLTAPSLTITSGTVVTLDEAMVSAGISNLGGAILGQGIIDGYVANEGNIALSGDSSFYGDVSNDCGTNAKIIISGGSNVTFFEDVLNDATGEIRVSPGCTATYFGDVTGTGNFTGTGTSYIEGDMRPGASPGTMHFEGDVVFGFSAALEAELGASANDLLDVDGALSLDGTLDVVLYDGFAPGAGDKFDVIDWGSLDGTFHTINLPGLSGGLLWDTSDLYLTGEIAVAGEVVPEPTTLALFAFGGVAVLARCRRKKRA